MTSRSFTPQNDAWRVGFLRTTLILACIFGLPAVISAYFSAPTYFYCLLYYLH